MAKGLIISSIGQVYTVREFKNDIFDFHEVCYIAKPRGIFRKDNFIPLVGDIVDFEVIDNNIAMINKIEKRRNVLIRPSISNIDQIIITIAVKEPKPDFLLVDKLIVTACHANIKPIICINKIDLTKEGNQKFDYYNNVGFKVVYLSAKENENIAELGGLIKGKVSVLSGLSGVGKSSIINKLLEKETTKTGSLSEKIEKGKNTTRNVDLFSCYGGYIADTPGFCKFELCDIEPDELKNFYPEFQCEKKCKFRECSHISEPECEIKKLVETKKIDNERYERYIVLYKQLKEKRKW